VEDKPYVDLPIPSGAFLVKDSVLKKSTYYFSLRAFFLSVLNGDKTSADSKDALLKQDVSSSGEDFIKVELSDDKQTNLPAEEVNKVIKEINDRLSFAFEDYDYDSREGSKMDMVTRALNPEPWQKDLYKMTLDFKP
jgi:hypothetical protein